MAVNLASARPRGYLTALSGASHAIPSSVHILAALGLVHVRHLRCVNVAAGLWIDATLTHH